ncbi:hypothetical protein ACIGXM_13705 [Kitasatospora sp. NPDC052896]|uniref:hypothetical protein n=1 Tax=Kitasatospora sp. NPDC052896 TaxID=3364061 RepID=UPI0037C4F739
MLTFRPSARTAVAVAAAATAVALGLPLPTVAHADSGPGTTGSASAVTAELTLDVSLLNNAVDVPVDVALNKVQSPAEQDGSMLTANVAGVAQPGPVNLLHADVGKSLTHVDSQGAEASVQLVNAELHAPGLPLTTLLGLDALSAEADCPVNGAPTATVTSPIKATVLGRPITLSVYGPTHVAVPGVGTVDVEFSKRTTTSTTAAASALQVSVAINPLNLNVAKVAGTITVAGVSCAKPGATDSSLPTSGGGSGSGGSGGGSGSGSGGGGTGAGSGAGSTGTGTTGGAGASGQPVADTSAPAAGASSTGPADPSASAHPANTSSLAFTGASGIVPLAAGGAALLAAGGGALWFTRRRRAAAHRH